MNSRGFTLIEMMIVVAIIGVLAGIAYPAYSDYLIKSRRTDAKTALLGLQQAQEKLRSNCNVYAENLAAANDCTPGDAANTDVKFSADSQEGWYTIAIASANGIGYVATATAKSKQAADNDCKVLKLTVSASAPNGAKTSINSSNVESTTANDTCW